MDVLLGVAAICASFSTYLNAQTVTSVGRIIFNPSYTCCVISPQMNSVILVVHTDIWSPQEMAESSAFCDHATPAWIRMPYVMYSVSRTVNGCITALVNAPRVLCLQESMRSISKGTYIRSDAVVL